MSRDLKELIKDGEILIAKLEKEIAERQNTLNAIKHTNEGFRKKLRKEQEKSK